MIYQFLATGFEDIEALAPLDIIRRAGLDITTVSITDDKVVYSAHGVGVVADALLERDTLMLQSQPPHRADDATH